MSNEDEENEFLLLKKRLNALPAQAIKVYEAQYLSLADQFNDFALFAQLQNFNGIYHSLEQNRKEPIIDSKEIQSDTDTINLRFPKIVDAFIPQSYKCLSYQHKETHLENEGIWKKLPVKRDFDRFL